MSFIIHDVKQGSDKWLEIRGKFNTASEAPVIMAASTKMKRDELLAIKAGYTEKEYSEWVQRNLFDKGHEFEAMARPIVEAMIGEELYPVTGSNGGYLASYDGLTMMYEISMEHKMWNPALAECVNKNELPPEYYWQLEHQLLVCPDMEKVIFVVSDGTKDNFASMEYYRVDGRAEELVRGWAQFNADLENYEHVVIPEKPIAETIEAFPALSVSLVGEVKATNLPVFKSRALTYIESINTDLQTDEDFANAEAAVKFCDNAEREIEVVKSQALSQTSSIDDLFRTMDQIKESLRQKRLTLTKLVKDRKESLKTEIITEARHKLISDIGKANEEFSPVVITGITADFPNAAKNKRTFASLRSAVNDELTRARLMLSERRDHVRASIKIISDAGKDNRFLFNDIQQLVDKQHDHLAMIVKQRVDEHKAEQQRKIEEEAQRRAQAIADERAAKEKREQAETQEQARKAELAQQVESPQEQSKSENVVSIPSKTETVSAKPHVKLQSSGGTFRPSDDDIIEALANHYKVNEFKVIGWLQGMNLERAAQRVAGA